MNWARAAALVVFGTNGAQAQTDLSTLRPLPRPHDLTASVAGGVAVDTPRPLPGPDFDVTVLDLPTIRPMPRPDFKVAPDVAAQVVAGVAPLIRPKSRPEFPAVQTPVVELAAQPLQPAAKPQKPAKASVKGSVCQSADIKGKTLPPIRSSTKGCSVPDAVLVTQVSGVALSPPVTINCEEAKALSVWVKTGLQPAFNNTILALNVVDSYVCRPRNNVRGNPVSVHGLGQAIDISAFVTNSGRTYTVAQSYNAQIRAAQKAGCGTFHTILGPGSDGYHENHIHFDVSPNGGRDYCR